MLIDIFKKQMYHKNHYKCNVLGVSQVSAIKKISDSELEVLKVLWEKDTAVSATEIYNTLKKSKGWEKTTVRTLIFRLMEKEALIQEKRNIFYYSPAITEQEYVKEQTRDFLKKIYKGNAKNLIASLFEQRYVNPKDVEELKLHWKEGINDTERDT